MNHLLILAIVVLAFYNENVFGFSSFNNKKLINRSSRLSMNVDYNSFLVTVIETSKKVDPDYVYGQVNAPPFVLPLAAVAIVAIAAIPFLLTSGEKALGISSLFQLSLLITIIFLIIRSTKIR